MATWRFHGWCPAAPSQADLEAISIAGINPLRAFTNPQPEEIVVPGRADPAIKRCLRVYRLNYAEIDITIAADWLPDGSRNLYVPANADDIDAFDAEEPRYEGFWRRSEDEGSNLPWPIPNPTWENRDKFLAALGQAEQVAEQESWRGFSYCRICKRQNGSRSFRLDVWEWPSGYRHYIADHGVRPSRDFEGFVMNHHSNHSRL